MSNGDSGGWWDFSGGTSPEFQVDPYGGYYNAPQLDYQGIEPSTWNYGAITPPYGYSGGWPTGGTEGSFFQEGSGLQWDTTNNQLLKAGQPFSLGGGQRFSLTGEPTQGGQEQGYSLGGDTRLAPGTLDMRVNPETGAYEMVDRALGSNIGRLGAGLGLGLLGMGASRLFSGNQPTYRPPVFGPSAASAAGQEAVLAAMRNGAGPSLTNALALGAGGQAGVAGQVAARVGRETQADIQAAPYQEAARMAALNQVLSLMTPGGETAINDPVQGALRQQLMDVLSGNSTGVSLATQKRQQLEEQETRNRLYHQLGQDYELTTAGIQTLNMLKERQRSEQDTERRATIATLSPLEQSRMQFATTAPVNLAQGREGIRRAALGDASNLSQFGNAGPAQNVTTLSQIVPVNTLLGGNPDQANIINTNLQSQAGMEAYRAANQRQQSLGAGIGGVFGTIAGTAAARPSSLEQYFARQYGTGQTPVYS